MNNRVIQIIDQLKDNNIEVCLLRNFDLTKNLDIGINKDVDILVRSSDVAKLKKVMSSEGFIEHNNNFVNDHLGFIKFFANEKQIINFDFQHGGLSWNQIVYLEEDIIWRRVRNEDGFNILSKEDYILMLIIHSIVGKRFFKEEYKSEISKVIKESDIEMKYIVNSLQMAFGINRGNVVYENIKKGRYKQILNVKSALIFSFISRSLSNIISFGRVLISWSIFRFRRFFSLGKVVSFIGINGVGKSTTTKIVREELNKMGVRCSYVYIGRGHKNIIPLEVLGRPYKKLEKRVEQNSRNVGNNRIKLVKKILYTIVAPIFTLDLLLRFVFVITPKRFVNDVVITDRYSTDMLVMDNVPVVFKKILYSLFPKPSLVIYLYNDLNVLVSRRPKHSIKDLERQKIIFDRITPIFKPLRIKTDNMGVTVNKALSAILKNQW